MPNSQNQLKIPFSKENSFAECLRHAKFSIIIETDAPASRQPFDSAIANNLNIARKSRQHDMVAAIAVNDRLHSEESYDPAPIAGQLGDASGKPILMHLSGKGTGKDRLNGQLAEAFSGGIQNFLAVTGDKSDKHPAPHGLQRNPVYTPGYMDSVEIIRHIQNSDYSCFIGAGVNPYKYNAADQYLQYFKMMRKIASGADFITTHIGWDMKKLQELQWFMQMRECNTPVIARLALLSGEKVRSNAENPFPGVHLSRPFAAMLERECSVNETQLLAAQLKRIALQVTGCRLLGYSGVQVAGIKDERTLDMVLNRINETMAELPSYNEWLTAWQEHHGEINFAPRSTSSFYTFTNLLTKDLQMYSAAESSSAYTPLPSPVWKDRIRSETFQLLEKMPVPSTLQKILDNLICQKCTEKETCSFSNAFYLCPKACPKRLVLGPCGGTQPDGTCEFGHRQCFFHRVVALAYRKHSLDRLEEGIDTL